MVDIIMPIYSKMPAPNYLENIEKIYDNTIDFNLIIIKSDLSVAKNRNIGLSMSKSDFIVYIDDDCSVGEGWLEGILRPLRTQGVGMVGHSITKDDGGDVEYKERMYVECHCMAMKKIPIHWNEENIGGGANDFDVCEQVRQRGYKIIGYKNLPIKHISMKRNQHKENWDNFHNRWGATKRELE